MVLSLSAIIVGLLLELLCSSQSVEVRIDVRLYDLYTRMKKGPKQGVEPRPLSSCLK